MNHELNTTRRSDPLLDTRLDATLRALGSVTPAQGLEHRVLARLSAERRTPHETRRFFGITGPLFGLCGAAMACLLIVMATVGHSRHANPALPPAIPMTGSGVGAASAAHLPGPQPVTPAPQGHGRTHAKNAAHALKPAGRATNQAAHDQTATHDTQK